MKGDQAKNSTGSMTIRVTPEVRAFIQAEQDRLGGCSANYAVRVLLGMALIDRTSH